MNDPLPLFSAMLKEALGDRVQGATFFEMLADDAVHEFPFALPDFVPVLEGRSAIEEHFKRLPEVLNMESTSNLSVYVTDRPEVVILEFCYQGVGQRTGYRYEQRCVSVITLGEGRIKHFRDYWNPLVLAASC